jgi:hypothetical protein
MPAGLGLESEDEEEGVKEGATSLSKSSNRPGFVESGCEGCEGPCASEEGSEERSMQGELNKEGLTCKSRAGVEGGQAAGREWNEGRDGVLQEGDEAENKEGRQEIGHANKDTHQQRKESQNQWQPGELRAAPAMVAFDGMLVQLSALPNLPLLGPILSKVLKRYEELQEAQQEEQQRLVL